LLIDNSEMNIFYAPDILLPDVTLSPEESAHCIRVLRLGAGAKVQLIDGKGGYYNAVVTLPDAKHCRLSVTETIESRAPRKYSVHIAIAPTKNMDRFEWFIEKSVEIGIDIITPLLCHHSERKVLKTDRLEKLIIATMKQAIIPGKPVLNELTSFKDFVGSIALRGTNRFIAHCEETDRKRFVDVCKAGKTTIVMIGPEGDFSPDEIELAISQDFIPVTLGGNRLRTETAGVLVCSFISALNDIHQQL
jgi:16S rRNA (uracil1498-N3)-methyltransferase